jgi:ring-1,2-phenylacetyl-CoA epoxidase subunit PaaB
VVKSSDVIATDPSQSEALFEPSEDKAYRHATFYHVPEGVKHL